MGLVDMTSSGSHIVPENSLDSLVYVLSHYLNSLVRIVVLVLCLTTVLLAIGTTACIFVFLLYLIRSY